MPTVSNLSSLLTTGAMDTNQLGINDNKGVTSGPIVSILNWYQYFVCIIGSTGTYLYKAWSVFKIWIYHVHLEIWLGYGYNH